MITQIAVVLGLVLLNGVFSGAEIAVIAIRRTRVNELAEGGTPGARAVAWLREHPERFLATVQVGITAVGATAAAFGGASIAEDLAPLLAQIPGFAPLAEPVALVLVIVAITFLSIVFGELIPKSLALRNSEGYALTIGRPMLLLGRVTAPVIWVLTATSNLVLKLFGDQTSFSETRMTVEELRQLMDEAAEAGQVGAQAGEIATRALDFDELVAADVMVPRRQIQAVRRTTTHEELLTLAREGAHSRLPVYGRDPDDIVGFVHLRDAIARDGGVDGTLREVPFVPETMPAPVLLRELQRLRNHLAIVVGEDGSVRGLVTIEDLLEEIVGEIYSESDLPVDAVREEADGSLLVDGGFPAHELERRYALTLPEGDYSTVAGLCTQVAERIPRSGTVLTLDDGTRIEVVEASPRRVRRVRVMRPAS